eukprot:XP_001693905.1 predicted protein [Chlamydomonas reinhardtii]
MPQRRLHCFRPYGFGVCGCVNAHTHIHCMKPSDAQTHQGGRPCLSYLSVHHHRSSTYHVLFRFFKRESCLLVVQFALSFLATVIEGAGW